MLSDSEANIISAQRVRTSIYCSEQPGSESTAPCACVKTHLKLLYLYNEESVWTSCCIADTSNTSNFHFFYCHFIHCKTLFWQGRCFSSDRKKKPVDLIQMRHTELLLMSSGQRLAVILEEQKQKSCLQPPHAYSYCGNEPPRGSSYPSFSLLVFAEATPAMPVRTPEEENKPTAGLVNTETSFNPLEKS